MRSFTVDVTCPRCGRSFEFVAHGTPVGMESRAVVRCDTCINNYVVCIMLINTSLATA